MLKTTRFHTPLGEMVAIADEQLLYFLGFADYTDLDNALRRLKRHTKSTLAHGRTTPLQSIQKELKDYFAGCLSEFKTPLCLLGTPFQKQVWEALQKIPYGQTYAYAELAAAIGRPSAFRAVAQANGANPLSIVIPCHRVINTGGKLGGYSSGLDRKKWLLHLERNDPSEPR